MTIEYKTDREGIVKTSDGVVLNKDPVALSAYKKHKDKDRRLQQLEQDMSEIKVLLQRILDK